MTSLTPIKPRGKGRKIAWTLPDGKRVKKDDQVSEMQVGSQDMGNAARHGKPKTPALIERLPTEILETILHMSKNLNFPRSSVRIGMLLSTESCFLAILINAFEPTWGIWFGCGINSIKSYYDFGADYDRCGGNPTYQSAVLACHWATLPRMLQAQQNWYRRFGRRRYFEHVAFTETWQKLDTHVRGTCPADSHLHGGHDHVYTAGGVAACFEADWQHFQILWTFYWPLSPVELDLHYLQMRTISFPPPFEHRHMSNYIDVHLQVEIPDRLLMQPVSWEDARWLFWLVRAGARPSERLTWEMTKLGYDHILTLEMELAFTLQRIYHALVFFKPDWPKHELGQKLAYVKKKKKKAEEMAKVGKVGLDTEKGKAVYRDFLKCFARQPANSAQKRMGEKETHEITKVMGYDYAAEGWGLVWTYAQKMLQSAYDSLPAVASS